MSLFDIENLQIIVENVPKPATLFMDTFFKRKVYNETITIKGEFKKGGRSIAPIVSGKLTTGITPKNGYSAEYFETPLVKLKDVTNADELLKKSFGESIVSKTTPAERAVRMVAESLRDFNDQITRREEYMCIQALMTGKIPVVGEGVNYEIDFGFTNKIALTKKWDDTNSTADPILDLTTGVLETLRKGFRRPDVAIFERSAYNAFLNRCMELKYLDNKYLTNARIEPKIKNPNVTYAGYLADPGIEIYIYDEWFLDDFTNPATPAEKQLMPKGQVLLACTTAEYSMQYGVIIQTDLLAGTFQNILSDRAVDSYINKDPAQRILSLSSRPLPIPHEVDSWCVMQVSKGD